VSSDSIVKGIIDDIINTAVKTAEVDKQKAKYLQHFINKHDTIVSNNTCVNLILKVYM
jgi:oligoribonuclease (3'-5' exoribonuclease)